MNRSVIHTSIHTFRALSPLRHNFISEQRSLRKWGWRPALLTVLLSVAGWEGRPVQVNSQPPKPHGIHGDHATGGLTYFWAVTLTAQTAFLCDCAWHGRLCWLLLHRSSMSFSMAALNMKPNPGVKLVPSWEADEEAANCLVPTAVGIKPLTVSSPEKQACIQNTQPLWLETESVKH